MASHLNPETENIGRDQADPSFRYKMPRLVLKPEKNKTLVTNLDEVAKALGVDPLWLVKYFTYHFGLQVTYDKDSGSAAFSGKRTEPVLSQCLKEFITQFVLCPTCNYPELTWHPKSKRDEVQIVCSACQHTSVLSQKNHSAFDKLLVYICSEDTKAKQAAKKATKKATMEGSMGGSAEEVAEKLAMGSVARVAMGGAARATMRCAAEEVAEEPAMGSVARVAKKAKDIMGGAAGAAAEIAEKTTKGGAAKAYKVNGSVNDGLWWDEATRTFI